ncbi:MAG: WD40 repeat domain-containing protein, partial [Verrucomicrobia bacterium]|nr:WD40 repeat domain-containing protein [Verrucomicrobiota bacterium]
EEERGGAGEIPHRRRLAAQWAMAPRLVALAPGADLALFGSPARDATSPTFQIETQSDGIVVVGRADGVAVSFLDPESGGAGEPSTRVPGSAGARVVTLTPSGRHLHVQSQQGRHRLWDLMTGRPVAKAASLEAHESPLRFRPDGSAWARYFFRADQWMLEVHPIGLGSHPPRSVPLESQPFAMEFDPAGRWLMTAHWDGAVRLWSPDTLEILAIPVRSSSGFSCAAISPDGSKLATGGWNQEAQVWTLPEGRPVTPPLRLGRYVATVEFSRDGRCLAVLGGDGMTRTWDLHLARRPTLPDSTLGPGTFLGNVVSNGRGVVAAADHSNRMHFWISDPGEAAGFRHQPAEMPTSEDRSALMHLTVSQDGRLAALAHQSGRIALWEVPGGRLRHQFQHGPNQHLFVVISPDSQWLASAGSDGVARCWHVATGQLAFPAFRQGSPVGTPAFSPDSRLLVIPAMDGRVRIVDRQTGAPLGPPLTHDHWAFNADFSPDGAHVVTAEGDHSVAALGAQVWELSSGRKVGAVMQHSDGVSIVRYFPGGARILTAGEDGQARVWNAADGAPQTPWMRSGRRIFRADISADGLMIATLDEGGRLRVWDAQNGELLSAGPVQEPVAHATFADAGRVVYSDPGTGALHWLSLPVAQGAVADLGALARVSAGFEIDATGGLAPLPVEILAQLYERLRSAMPGHFQVRLHDPEWHRQELARATAAGELFAIRFHAAALNGHRTSEWPGNAGNAVGAKPAEGGPGD